MGMGTVTYTGASTALESAIGAAQTAVGGLAGPVAAIMAKTGFFDALSITAGGLVSGMGWLVLKRWALNAGGIGNSQ